MNRRTFLGSALAFAALGSVGAGPRRGYLKVYEAYTRRAFVYHGFGTALIMRGTYLDHLSRSALAEERRRQLDPPDEDHEAFLAKMKEDNAAWHDVVFSADSSMASGDRFTGNDDGWTLRLFADDTEEVLEKVEWVRKPTMMHRHLYPHLNIWSELYIARFKRTVAAPDVVLLKVAGGYGQTKLVWKDLRGKENAR